MSKDFQRIDNLLGQGILASYLLGFDQAQEENKPKIAAVRKINLADGDPIDLNFEVRPAEAIDYFQRKRIVTKETFNKLEREAKAAAFMVAGIYREDILTAFKTEIEDALESGQSQKYVVNNFKQILADGKHKELGDYHLENIFRTNMQMAYGVGRRKALEEVSDILPIWEYSAVNDDRTRPTHRALDGVQFPANHEFWNTHYPPWEWACRCSVFAVADYRNNYNHQNPNPDTTIIYDKNGLPEKAEYLNQVVDLKVTKFVGVPKIADLEKALTAAAKAAKDARLLNHQNIPSVIVDAAREIRLEKKEVLTGWDKDGNNVGRFVGDNETVSYPWRVEPLLKDGFDIHNHPKGEGLYYESFSHDDLFYMVNLEKKVSYAVTQNYLYQMRRPKNGWTPDIYDKFYDSYEQNRAKIASKLNKMIRENELTIEQAEDLERHLIWKEVAKDLKFKYRRFKVSEL